MQRSSRPPLSLAPSMRAGRANAGQATLARFFRMAEDLDLSDLQQCRLMKCPSPQVLKQYRSGHGARLNNTQQQRLSLLVGIWAALLGKDPGGDRAWRFMHEPNRKSPFKGEPPLHYMVEGGLPALRDVAHHVTEQTFRP
jgi:hypothetical protein